MRRQLCPAETPANVTNAGNGPGEVLARRRSAGSRDRLDRAGAGDRLWVDLDCVAHQVPALLDIDVSTRDFPLKGKGRVTFTAECCLGRSTQGIALATGWPCLPFLPDLTPEVLERRRQEPPAGAEQPPPEAFRGDLRLLAWVVRVLDDVPRHPARVADPLAREAVTPGLRQFLPDEAARQLSARPEQGVDVPPAASPLVDPEGFQVSSQAISQPPKQLSDGPGELLVAHRLPRPDGEEVRRRPCLETPPQAPRLPPGPQVPAAPAAPRPAAPHPPQAASLQVGDPPGVSTAGRPFCRVRFASGGRSVRRGRLAKKRFFSGEGDIRGVVPRRRVQ
jgi:hypothetical protein